MISTQLYSEYLELLDASQTESGLVHLGYLLKDQIALISHLLKSLNDIDTFLYFIKFRYLLKFTINMVDLQ